MAKRENDLSERTLAEKVDGAGDRQTGLGKLSKVKRAKPSAKTPTRRGRFANTLKADVPPVDPSRAMAQAFLQSIETDLHAKDRKTGARIPTLHERMRKEGVRAQFKGSEPGRLPPRIKRRPKTKGKRK